MIEIKIFLYIINPYDAIVVVDHSKLAHAQGDDDDNHDTVSDFFF